VRSGAWIVDEWKLSAPKLQIRETSTLSAMGVPGVKRVLVVVGRLDNGGGILGTSK
jgi:hypothetical protein